MENYEKKHKESLEKTKQELKALEDSDKQVDEFVHFYNNYLKLVHNDIVKQMPPLTDCQKEFVKCFYNEFVKK